MKIHNLIILGILALLVVSCHKDPPKTYDDTDATITVYNTEFDFSIYNTFLIPDSTVLRTNYFTDQQVTNFYKSGGTSDLTLELVQQRFLGLGYTEASSVEDADFIVVPTIVHVESDETVIYYPGWWWGYPGYGIDIGIGFGFKNSQYYYYYPVYPWYPTGVPIQVSTYTGALIVEMMDADSYRAVKEWQATHPDPPGDDDNPPEYEINWQAIIGGYVTDDADYNKERAVNGMDEAMAQSPYLIK